VSRERGSPQRIRIVAGELRNRRLVVPGGGSVRPTSERAREALFDILGPRIAEARVLDAFAGSGALGLEALSRGAAWVTFVEQDREALAALCANVEALGVGARSAVVAGTVDRVVVPSVAGAPFDVVLADPPYADEGRVELPAFFSGSGALAANPIVVVERDRRSPPSGDASGRLVLARTARYGDTCLDFFRAAASGS
jgi:16S rRNA (guanine(966)-N(2))-methyltransferase RsmD